MKESLRTSHFRRASLQSTLMGIPICNSRLIERNCCSLKVDPRSFERLIDRRVPIALRIKAFLGYCQCGVFFNLPLGAWCLGGTLGVRKFLRTHRDEYTILSLINPFGVRCRRQRWDAFTGTALELAVSGSEARSPEV